MAYSIATWNWTPDTWSLDVKSTTILSLIKANGSFKKLSALNQFEDVLITEPLTKQDFELYGIEDTSIIPQSEWENLIDFDIYTWTDDVNIPKAEIQVPHYTLLDGLSAPKLLMYSENANPVVNVEAIPNGQLIKPSGDIQLKLLEKINTVKLTGSALGSGVIKTIYSIDSGKTWKSYDVINNLEITIDITQLEDVKNKGLSIQDFNNMNVKWDDIIKDGKIRFAYYLEIGNEADVANVDKLEINMDLVGRWKKAIHPTDYDYEYDNTNLYITFKTNGSYKANYAE